MHIRIENILGVDLAEIDCAPVALVAGPNGAGKSSIADATASALTGSPMLRGLRTKSALPAVIYRGRPSGSVKVSLGDENAVTLTYPDGKVLTRGKPPTVSEIAAGQVRPFSIREEKVRATWFATALGSEPGRDDLAAALAENPIFNDQAVAKIIEKHDQLGWKGTLDYYSEKNRERKTEYRLLTGQIWSKNAYEKFSTVVDTGPDLQETLKELEKGRDELEIIWRDAKASGNGMTLALVQEAEKKVAEEKRIQADLDECLRDVRELNQEAEDMVEPKGPNSDGIQTWVIKQCPHHSCLRDIAVVVADDGEVKVEHTGELTGKEDDETLRVQLEEYRQKATAILNRQRELSQRREELMAEKAGVKAAEELLLKARGMTKSCSAEEVAYAKDAYEKANKALEDYRLWLKAGKLDRSIKAVDEVIALMAPNGLPKKLLATKLLEMNANFLEPIGKEIGLPYGPTIEEGLNVKVCGLEYELCSAGEKQAADFALQLAVAKRDGEALVIMDGADILVEPYRSGLLRVLNRTRVPALVCIAAGAPEDLGVMDDSQTLYWMNQQWAEKVSRET